MWRWITLGVLIVLPSVVDADCGWVLMMPTRLSNKVDAERQAAVILTPP